MQVLASRAHALFAVVLALLATACTGESSPDDPIDELIRSIPDPEDVQEVDDMDPCGTSCPDPSQFCQYHLRTYQHGSEIFPMLDPLGDVVCPGADLQGDSLRDGIPSPITVPRGGGDVVLTSNPNGSHRSSVHVDEVSLASVAGAVNEILRGQPEEFPADVQISISNLRSREELQIALQASGSYFGLFEASAGFELEESERYSAFAIQVHQNFYSMAFERPSRPHEFYAPGVTAADFAGQVGEGNPACYVSQVTYGRVFYLLIQATENEADMEATLRANYLDFVEGSGRFRHFSEFSNVKISAYAYGGDQDEVLASIQTLGRWREFWDHLRASNDVLTAKALSYTVRSIATDRVMQNAIAASFEVSDCVFPEDCPMTLLSPRSGARLDNGCAVDPEPIEWSFDWTDCPNAEAYHLQVSHGSSLVIDNDHLGDSRFNYRTSTPFIRMDSGWKWRVRAKTFGEWEPWSQTESFSIEPVNTDCVTGVVLYTHPDHRGGSQFIDRNVCLEDIDGWDDEVDSLVLKNVRGVRLCEDPARFDYGPCFFFNHDCRDTEEHSFRRNTATYLEIDFGF